MDVKIGIIGGNGVAATNRLCQIIEQRIINLGGYRDAHHPEMIIWQATQVPSRSMYLEGRGESFIPEYIEIGKKLKACGCNELCMCCNTAHYAIKELEEGIQLPFINILKEVANNCKKVNAKQIGVICSDGLRKFKIYDAYLRDAIPGVSIIYPNAEIQKLVTQGICNAKNSKRENPNCNEYPEKLFSQVCNWFIKEGVDCIVGGCTDINAVFRPSTWKGIPYIDSLQVLADAILRDTKHNKPIQ